MVIWLIGLSGAGKTTIGREVCRQWKAIAPNTVLVDGDEIRALFKHEQRGDAYTVEGRRANAERITELCLWLDRQDINIVCCILSLFPEMRMANRNQFSAYYEVYIRAALETLVARDVKSIYAPAVREETRDVVGIDIPFPEPVDADLIVDNDFNSRTPFEFARNILNSAGVA